MSASLYITSSCKIDNRNVFKDGEILLTGTTNGTEWLIEGYKHFAFDYPKFYRMDNLSKAGWLAAEILLSNKDLTLYKPEDVGIVLANKSSSLDTDIKYFDSTKAIPSPALFVYTLPNIVLGEISIRHRLKGENALFVFDRFDPAFIAGYVASLFAGSSVECCICGWLDFFDNDIDVAVYLVEKRNDRRAVSFTEENINHIYQLTHG